MVIGEFFEHQEEEAHSTVTYRCQWASTQRHICLTQTRLQPPMAVWTLHYGQMYMYYSYIGALSLFSTMVLQLRTTVCCCVMHGPECLLVYWCDMLFLYNCCCEP